MVKIISSTLIEVMVAMVILSLAFGIGLMTYFNIIGSTKSLASLKAQIILNEIAAETIIEQSFFDEELDIERMHITKEFVQYNGSNDTYILVLKATGPSNQVLANLKKIVLNK